MTNAINLNEPIKAPVKAEKKSTVGDLIMSYKDKFASALPDVITPERFARIAANAVAANPQLAQCSQTSLIGALLQSATVGLEVNSSLGQAYLIPYKNFKTGKMEAQFQMSYKGLMELCHRSGQLRDIQAHCVYEGDTFEYELGLEPKLRHIPAMTGRGKMVWCYAVYHLNNGGFGFEVMSVEDLNRHRAKYSKAKNSPWDTAFEEMAKKTVIKKALKYAPVSSEFTRATTADERTSNVNLKADFIEPEVMFDDDMIVDPENVTVVDQDGVIQEG